MRDFDFGRFSHIDTLGMNAAYRYWQTIDWRPTHYACLDDALIDTHHKEILALVDEGIIDSFFLTARILDYRPDLAGHEKVRFLDEVIEHWHTVRGRKLGLKYVEAPAFRTNQPNLLTTGAYAARYAAMLGYEEIGLFGIDLRYETLDTARPLDGERLILHASPQTNPNYFFDDYQREGDMFHVPNPASHAVDLHLEAFRALRDDFAAFGVETHILNTNSASRLVEEAVFPFEDPTRFLREPAVGAVVIPVTPGECGQVLSNLDLLGQPSAAPWLGRKPERRPALVFVFNNSSAAEAEAAIRAKLSALPGVEASFGDVRFVNLALEGDADLYERSNQAQPGKEGLRAGPNNMFFGAMKAVAGIPGHALYIETDCIPVRPDWLGAANRLLEGAVRPWISGSIYVGHDALGPKEMRHINGNAIYASGDPAFQDFVETVWRPHLASVLGERPELPFDCVIEDIFQRADSRLGEEDRHWKLARRLAHRQQYSLFIANMAGPPTHGEALAVAIEETVKAAPECHFVHSRQLAEAYAKTLQIAGTADLPTVLDVLRGSREPAVRPASHAAGQRNGARRVAGAVRQQLKRIAGKTRN